MTGVANSILELIGNTPMLRLRRITPAGSPPILAKLEGANPTGSVKDRVALAIVEDAERRGVLRPGCTIVEATTGNTGMALAMVAAVRGYRLVIFMPENAPPDRRKLLLRLGVQIQLTPTDMGMHGAQKAAREVTASDPSVICLDLFHNQAVVQVHHETTAREILDATGGDIGAFVAGVGTAGTITGVGERLKEHDPSIRVVAVEPATSRVLSRGVAGTHSIPGIGPDFVPPLLNRSVIDEIISVTDDEANQAALRLACEEGVQAGISSGANVVAALRVAQSLGSRKTVVTVLPDRGDRYIDFPL